MKRKKDTKTGAKKTTARRKRHDPIASFRALLDDPGLLDRAVMVNGNLAVPVGGKRRGGYVCVNDEKHARPLIEQLSKLEGFPNLRHEPGLEGEYPDNVFWGEPAPEHPETDWMEFDFASDILAEGRHYGYSDEAIRTHIAERYGSAMAELVMGPLAAT